MKKWVMRIRLNKKGLKFMYLVIWAVMFSAFLIIVLFFVSAFVRQQIDVRDAEARVFINRLLFIPQKGKNLF